MPKLTINGTEIEVAPGTSIIQAAEQLGVEIPRFCYHDRLSVPANCRMCLVEVKGGPPKPVASCAMACGEGMVVETESDMVKKARKGVMEMLLINHPLDCPICDQGGECDLQDQAVAYGFDRSRFHENKRAVPDKELGPLIKTSMNRCINCTRCVRFAEEVAGSPVLGQLHRGEDAEITTFIGDLVKTELSGNLIDVCPVGALLSKPYSFKARPWELRKTETIDVHDALGCNIRVDARGREVMRVLPRLHEDINEEWIDDRTRFSYDGLNRGRLDRPYIREEKSGKLKEVSWEEAFAYIAERLRGIKGTEIAGLVGDLCEVESMVALKDLLTAFGSGNMDCRTDGANFDVSERAGYLFNGTIAGIDQADVILLVGTNPRHEATLLNARLRRNRMDRGVKIGLIGEAVDLTYSYKHLGTGPADLEKAAAEFLKGAQKSMIIAGASVFRREDGAALHYALGQLAKNTGATFNMLHTAASRVGALDIGFVPQKRGKGFADIVAGTKDGTIKVLYMLGVDEFDARAQIGWKTFVIYQGHHGDRGAARADVILPGAAFTEKDGIFVNTEGRPQIAKQASYPPGEAREDWKILRALSEALGLKLSYDTPLQLRERIFREWPHLGQFDVIQPAEDAEFGEKGKPSKDAFAPAGENYYLKNAICRASKTMHECVQEFILAEQLSEAAE
ncbi:MAG: NADH-quinone oxidoreductase subunit G [Alphaproteobacteria bacterium]|nr:NADH-quinone oxidoreductase subunit G [Alphaproteobacteria bacterium]